MRKIKADKIEGVSQPPPDKNKQRTDNMITNNLLKEKLKENNLSPRKIARLIDISENCVFQYIMGRRTPRWQKAQDIALILKTPAEKLFPNLRKNIIQKCKTCDMPEEIKRKNKTIEHNSGFCSECYRLKELKENYDLNRADMLQHEKAERRDR